MPEPIAVIGSGCRFPGNANTPSALWGVLCDPKDLLVEIPEKRFSTRGFYHENGRYHGHSNVQRAYLLSDTAQGTHRHFDAQFFGISPAEANTMDPQIRLLLETVYESLESAGQPIELLRGSNTAVYAGLMAADYEHLMGRDENTLGLYHVTGTSRALLSNRVSYFFDWHGPSITIDTACSSSLYAVHYAVQQIRSGASKVAIAAGSNLILDPINFISESKLQMLSPNGTGRMWDAAADGYARGEGVAVLVLKSLAAAEADGDNIECVIRETAVNQDGRTKSITIPSADAQTELIRDCYHRAGLDLGEVSNHPQFFEAHGTGTPTGDPIEAEAISSAFRRTGATPLYVGSIKTVIGHTEGTAGIAGILKASLALQHSRIPPNLHFEHLNPRIKPFYTNLCIPTGSIAWPTVTKGSPRRASVNSFGFGGANAHAILESYEPSPERNVHVAHPDASCVTAGPFVISATSDVSLAGYISTMRDYLYEHGKNVNLADLAYTLHSRRSRFPLGLSLSASTSQQLATKLDQVLLSVSSHGGGQIGTRIRQSLGKSTPEPRLLGIFTGQGSQWARMGAELISISPLARAVLDQLDARLARLPTEDRPSWSLTEELLKEATSSRVSEAALSQPLCTAVQIILVELLRSAKVKLTDVVGHSSGEIAALYAAGVLTAENAICIAYYRGMHAYLAHGPDGENGAMLAVGSTLEDIEELLDEPEFQGRVCVAAINSSTSITVSGNATAIEELRAIMQDEKKFAKVLKIDKAYHSHHMIPCSTRYLQSMQNLDLEVHVSSEVRWFSSVSEDELDLMESIRGPYWDRNMLSPVLFKQALERACGSPGLRQFDLAIEIGAHPALKGPALQTLHEAYGQSIPYVGLLQRSSHDIEAIADGLGYLWTHLGKTAVNLNGYEQFVYGTTSPRNLIGGLPSYHWTHEREYWHEFRYTKAVRQRSDPVHEILGHLCPDSTEKEMRWKHILRPSEIQWMQGHCLQGQIVFPAAGYIVSALEASILLIKHRRKTGSVVEILNLHVVQALTFDNEDHGVEILVNLTDISQHGDTLITAKFTYNAEAGSHSTTLGVLSSGSIRIHLGTPFPHALASRGERAPDLIRLEADDFYASLSELEYQYSGPFKALTGLERRLGDATGHIQDVSGSQMLVHPATLDAALQTVLLAASYPRDGALWSMHVPTKVRRVSFSLGLCIQGASKGAKLVFDSTVPAKVDPTLIGGDVDIYAPSQSHAMMQVEGLECVPFSPASAEGDKALFSSTVWGPAFPVAEEVAFDGAPSNKEYKLACFLERMACFYLKALDQSVPLNHPSRHSGPYTQLFRFASHQLASLRNGNCSFWDETWAHDTSESIDSASREYGTIIDVRFLRAIGQQLSEIAVGDASPIEIGMKGNLLAEYYQHGLGMGQYCRYLSRVVKQIVHRFPRLRCLEIGAGTGGATRSILREAGQTFSSYTFTDISSGFFEVAQATFENQTEKLEFKVLDISQDPCLQGFEKHSYDLIIASAVLHATPSISQTLKNIRRLLRPGGYLAVIEVQAEAPARVGTMFGAFSGWWLGAEEGRELSPCLGLTEWDDFLRQTGFSGCDTTTPDPNPFIQPMTLFVSQAVDERVLFRRSPLSYGPNLSCLGRGPLFEDLVLLGGSTLKTARIAAQLKLLLRQYCGELKTARTLVDLQAIGVSSTTTVLSLTELDRQIFTYISEPHQWNSLKLLLQNTGSLLWVSQGRRADNCHANMTIGLLRSVAHELPGLEIQSLDIEDPGSLNARFIGEAALRFKAETLWHREGSDVHPYNTVERELVINISGQTVVPRLMINMDMNDRYNSSRRPIFSNGDHSRSVLKVSPDDHGHRYYVRQGTGLFDTRGASNAEIVDYSLLAPVRTAGGGHKFLSLGRSKSAQPAQPAKIWVALSVEATSTISPTSLVELDADVTCKVSGSEAMLLYQVSLHHLASLILDGTAEGHRVLLHEPGSDLMAVMKDRTKNTGVIVSASTASHDCPGGYLHIHPFAPERTLHRMRLDLVNVFVDLGSTNDRHQAVRQVQAHLSDWCRLETIKTLYGWGSRDPSSNHAAEMQMQLKDSVTRAASDIADFSAAGAQLHELNISSIRGHEILLPHQSVINWTDKNHIITRILPVDSQPLFHSTKTYWLVGLTGSLGRSLCVWMVQHGARYVAMTSRTPHVEESWRQEMNDLGALVKIFTCDITEEASLKAVHSEICATMPSISGIAQGAMVLADKNLGDMSLEDFQKVTRPKVEGSINLDSLFQGELDFFVFLSSISPVVGIPGQSAYAAGNMFMLSLAEQRRQRGLAASVVHIGPILGAGYITERNHDTTYMLQSMASMHMSEHDFHQLFAEGIMAGQTRSSGSGEITAGISCVRLNQSTQPKWAPNPFMGHLLLQGEDTSDAKPTSSSRHISLERQLADARTHNEVQNLVREAFLDKLSALFRLDVDAMDPANTDITRLDELGIDSLMAVEIRGWLMQNLKVNFPVLKILSGISVGELIHAAVAGITPAMIPKAQPGPTNAGVLEPSLEAIEVDLEPHADTESLSVDTPVSPTARNGAAGEGEQPGSSSPSVALIEPGLRKNSPASGPLDRCVLSTFDVSYTQRMFWFASRLFEDDTSLNHTALFRLTGPLRVRDLKKAVDAIVQNHESLRSFIDASDGKLMQGVKATSTLQLEHYWINNEEDAFKAAREIHSKIYRPEIGDSLCLQLLSFSSTVQYLVFGGTGLVMDGVSSQIFLRDLSQHYNQDSDDLKRVIPQYQDFVRSQNQAVHAGELEKELLFWKAQYSDFPPPLPILRVSDAISRPALTTFSHIKMDARVGHKTKHRIREVCRQYRVTPFHFYLTCFRALIARLTDADDISIGIGDAHRLDDAAMNCIGSFFNVLPLRFTTLLSSRFKDVLQETCKTTYQALEHSRLPFQALLDELDAPRSATCTPIFQAFIDYRQGQREKQKWSNCDLEMLSFDISKTGYDLNLDIIDDPDGECMLMLFVRSDLYTAAEAGNVMTSYGMLVEAFANTPRSSIVEPDMFEHDQVRKAIQFSQGRVRESRWPDTVIHRFEDLARMYPDEIAVTCGADQAVTYSQLLMLSESIAAGITVSGVTAGSIVAVLQEPTTHWIASILAILRLGAVYVPLDLSAPWSRLVAAVQECEPCLVLVDNDTACQARHLQSPDLLVLDVSTFSTTLTTPVPPIAARSGAPALILYTSGSTNVPKGIVLKHEGIRNQVEPMQEVYGIGAEVVLQQSSCSFDLSYSQIFTALCFGGSVCIVPRHIRGDAFAITGLMASQGITYTLATPTEYASWLRYGQVEILRDSCWMHSVCAGEQVASSLMAQFKALHKHDLRLFNAYGPTELSVLVTAMELQYEDLDDPRCGRRIPSGTVLPNYSLYVVDRGLHILPPGVQGEIYLGGAGIAAGYINNETLTANNFVPDIFASEYFKSQGWTTMHRVGDIGRWTVDGSIVIEGRISGDTQVKLHGIRLDLHEVEDAILQAAGESLSEVTVSLRSSSDAGRDFLVAHAVFRPDFPPEGRDEFLQRLVSRLQLPNYMCPAVIIPLEAMPQTLSSKLDRRAIATLPLPAFIWRGDQTGCSPMLSQTEARLRDIWVDMIPGSSCIIHRITRETDFFNIGGTSLLLIGLQARIRVTFNIRVPVADMFQLSSLGGVSRLIENQHVVPMEPIDWDHETELPQAALEAVRPVKDVVDDASVVVLTGSTGYLGRAILDALIADEQVKTIHCIGIRKVATRGEMIGLQKVHLYEGNLTQPRLGLSEEDTRIIFSTATRIIHNGADASHMRHYHSLRLPNLQSTKELTKMAAKLGRRIAFHYVSTTTLSPYYAAGTGHSIFPPVSLAAYSPPTDGFGGYPATKWASERFLERLHNHWLKFGGWPVAVHRPSLISRAVDQPALDVVHNVRHFARRMRAVPIAPNVVGYLDEVSLKAVVDGIVMALHEPNIAASSVRFFHYCGKEKLSLSDMKSWIMGTDGDIVDIGDAEELPLNEWAKRAADIGMDPTVVTWVASVAGQRDLIFPMVVDYEER